MQKDGTRAERRLRRVLGKEKVKETKGAGSSEATKGE